MKPSTPWRLASNKLKRSFEARTGLFEQYRTWGTTGRVDTRPLVWVHAASVGEGLHALPLIQRFRAERPEVQIAFTHFSPSAENFAAQVGADFHAYLPFDTSKNARVALDALRPSLIVFSKLDVWPKLVKEAKKRSVKLALTSATLAPKSTRATFLGRLLLGAAYNKLDVVGAIDRDDAARLVKLGVNPQNVQVTGDLRYDQVWERAQKAPALDLIKSLTSTRPTLIAGSTWSADEKHLLPAWKQVATRIPGARLIVAPHEMDKNHLDSIKHWAKENGLSVSSFQNPDAADADVMVIDGYGVLADLYSVADVAYVGGGFHKAGLHSLVEPAAFGLPILFGPRFESSRDAVLMKDQGCGLVCNNANDFLTVLSDLLLNAEKRRQIGAVTKETFLKELGAAGRTYELIRGRT